MKQILFSGIFFLSCIIAAKAQVNPKLQLQQYEHELLKLATTMNDGENQNERLEACFAFIPKLVEALKVKGSFEYPFESLQTISIQYPEDRSFRIFTWAVAVGIDGYRYYGAIQKNKEQLELYPLFDYSDSLYNPIDTVLRAESWYGALYYNIVESKFKGKMYYTLFGWDGNDLFSNKKLLEILSFDEAGKPVFGAPLFSFKGEEGKYTQHRFFLEYTKKASATLNYSEKERMILYDHLAPLFDKGKDMAFTFAPDGEYEGFKLKGGRWVHVGSPFKQKKGGFDDPPVPAPLGGSK